jgi:3-oxoacyl-[acyl-carrier-protein] synthase III
VGSPPSQWLLMERSPSGEPAPHVARVCAVGRALPSTRVSTEELMASTRHHTHIDLERLTGVHERRMVEGTDGSLALAVGAATDCLAHTNYGPDDLDAVISCSITKFRDGLVQWLDPPMA